VAESAHPDIEERRLRGGWGHEVILSSHRREVRAAEPAQSDFLAPIHKTCAPRGIATTVRRQHFVNRFHSSPAFGCVQARPRVQRLGGGSPRPSQSNRGNDYHPKPVSTTDGPPQEGVDPCSSPSDSCWRSSLSHCCSRCAGAAIRATRAPPAPASP